VTLCASKKTNEVFVSKTFHTQQWKPSITIESTALMRLHGCPHVVQFFDSKQLDVSSRTLRLVYYKNGDLLSLLQDIGPAEEKLARTLFRMCLIGIKASHDKNIIHGDIKPDNIMLDSNYNCHIGDFGMSTLKQFSTDSVCTEFKGTKDYMAPEIFLSNYNYDGKKADVWGLGCLLFVIIFGYHPFSHEGATTRDACYRLYQSKRELFWELHERNLEIPLSLETKRFIERMMYISPNYRPSIDEVLDDTWLSPSTISSTCPVTTAVFSSSHNDSFDRRDCLSNRSSNCNNISFSSSSRTNVSSDSAFDTIHPPTPSRPSSLSFNSVIGSMLSSLRLSSTSSRHSNIIAIDASAPAAATHLREVSGGTTYGPTSSGSSGYYNNIELVDVIERLKSQMLQREQSAN